MRVASTFIGAAMLMSALVLPALADEMQMKPGMMMMMGPQGTMMTMQMDDSKMCKEMKDMMDKAPAMKGPMMMMIGSDGKMHMMDDMKMSDGKMMSDMMMQK